MRREEKKENLQENLKEKNQEEIKNEDEKKEEKLQLLEEEQFKGQLMKKGDYTVHVKILN